jgi:hypothetical protein
MYLRNPWEYAARISVPILLAIQDRPVTGSHSVPALPVPDTKRIQNCIFLRPHSLPFTEKLVWKTEKKNAPGYSKYLNFTQTWMWFGENQHKNSTFQRLYRAAVKSRDFKWKGKKPESKSNNNNKLSPVPVCDELQVMLIEITKHFYLQIHCRAWSRF